MKIINFLYTKYCISFIICLISCFIIFFIFSLIGNLNEDYLFNTIVNISIINSLQIMIHVSAFIFLLSVILLLILLRSKNEIIIIKSYVSSKKLILFFLPVTLIFTALEVNKKSIGLLIEDFKNDMTGLNDNLAVKILINKNGINETYSVFKNINSNNLEGTEYRSYNIRNNTVIDAQFSDNLELMNNKLVANDYTKYNKNIIKDFKTKKIFETNFLDLLDYNSIVKNISKQKNFFKMTHINLLIFSILLFSFIFLIFFNRKYLSTKQGLGYPILICLSFIIYSFLVFSNSLTIYKQLFELLACVIIGISILKISLNE